MQRNKLFNVLVLGALTLGGCGTAADPGDVTPDAALADTTHDAGPLVADASSPTPDAGEEAVDAGSEDPEDAGGGVCMWAGMDPCPC